MKSICETCTAPYCHEEVICPECNGQGLFSAMLIGEESNDYGLKLQPELPCPVCDGRGTVTFYCPQYVDRTVPV